ncbi:MAG: T9SS type A sorting domain-containing protein [Ginsengibacter sp.]
MNKKFTITVVLITMAFISFAQVCPTYFKRNNGKGVCNVGAEIQMYFNTAPNPVPRIDSIYINNAKVNVSMLNIDVSNLAAKGYISYCMSEKLPPANTLKVFFNSTSGDGMVGGTSVCNVSEEPQGGPLPVVLSRFDVQRQSSNTVLVSWKTEQEINSDRFELQRSFNNSPFETVATILSKNSNSNTAQFYTFTDPNSLAGVSLYRIKMIDKDNSFSFSTVKLVKGTGGTSDFTVFPNPSNGSAKITIADLNESKKVMIFDYLGRVVRQTSFANGNSVDITNLQKGGYIIKVIGEKTGVSSVQKITVIN